ncbi:MAG: response regulator [Oscillatoria princeps RMCB-10]|jgi:light-regulated signal transduction histidine kinase (bacteriophytochrome)|nr:response regulator [Oscillatoria princeps RMCB-10]
MDKTFQGLVQTKILIVDDMPDNLRVLSGVLAERGYSVHKALNGELALKTCEKAIPDLILLDILMPGLDGYEVCQRLKADETTRNIPVIFLSALNDPFDKVKAFSCGGADYITKPFQAEEVLARIAHQLTIQQQQRLLAEQNADLQKLNAELRRSNTELEQFASVAAHDLRVPLTVMIASARLLAAYSESSLDTRAKSCLERIIAAGARMNRLIDDLLSYSRVGTRTPEFEPADCLTVLTEALANLQEEIAASGASITCSELPTVLANKAQLVQLFQNLISNAIKFRRPEIPPVIKISAEALNLSEWTIGVHDSGIGIEPQNFERIFLIFERLHSQREYPGTGIGLAICKKIVEQHGGRIWVESQPGVCTTFYFTLRSQ